MYLFSGGKAGRGLIKKFENLNIAVKAIVDNSFELYKAGILGIKVIGVEELKSMNTGNAIIVISSPKYERDIRIQLVENGILNGKRVWENLVQK